MTDEELNALVAENSQAIREMRQESEKRWEEWRRKSERDSEEWRRKSERLWQEILASRRETDRLITHLNRDVGRIGNRFGDYTESLFLPSLERTLREQFHMSVIIVRQRAQMNGEHLELDMVAHAGDQRDEVYLVEIKSRLRQDGIDQLLDQLHRFPRFFPEHRGKRLFGILAALDIPPDLRAQVLKAGLYLATIKDEVFEIVSPDDFEPRAFGLRKA